ncbi:8-amino-7-oxononanoate synthase [uncultured Desulfuromonas sp.]|uniref:8-amino-7-oxononanoate synthase n=1 Tax=uncultured Desulfuromonas sp. TaxID=181013 RepID=UPI00261F82BA|nr:8-amino-7-oxononanoate synthase [uncultured Desulfuromonas sp.]
MEDWRRQLEELRGRGMLRTLRTVESPQGPRVVLEGREVLLLCSNDYLGLASHPALVEAALSATSRFGAGSGASRLVSGTMSSHALLEERLAAFKGTEAALLFNSGYAANTGILQGLFGPDDLIFSDALNHASIIDGCRLSRARVLAYPHRDVKALEGLMEAEASRRKGRWLIVTDGVFSMDGDLAPLPELVRLKERHDALLMVDDAHATGVLGEGGRGTAEHLGCLGAVDLHMGTLGKALGCFGAYLAAGRTVIDTLVNRSRPFIFSTSLPPAAPAAAYAALDIVEGAEGARLRRSLEGNRALFAGRLEGHGLDLLGSRSQIVPVLTGEPEPTMTATERLLEAGVFVQGIRPPTVAEGKCRLRATVMATHRPEDLLRAADGILAALGEGTA